jgi:uncharacterized protein YjbK
MKKEIELKYLFAGKSDFDLFKEFLIPYMCGENKNLKQTNYFFDTPSLSLKKKGICLRLRQQGKDYILCAKQSLRGKDNLSIRLEFEGGITNNVAELVYKSYLSPLDIFLLLPTKTKEDITTHKILCKNIKKISKMGLQIIGSFINQRKVMPVKIAEQIIMMEFDHSIFPNSNEFFEVEIEFLSEKHMKNMRHNIEKLFKDAKIKTFSSSSKSSRLYKILFG